MQASTAVTGAVAMSKAAGNLALWASARQAEKETELLGDIQSMLLGRYSKPSPSRRRDVIHPSEMANSSWCPRSTVYRLLGTMPTETYKAPGFQMQNIFENGHDIHARWQGWVRDLGKLFGLWECLVCGYTWEALSPTECGSGCTKNAQLLRYREVPIDGEHLYRIYGHADGAYLLDNDSFGIIEVKSIGLGTLRMDVPDLVKEYTVRTDAGKSIVDTDGLWKGLHRPLAPHLRQTNIYARLLTEMGYPVKKITFLYEYKANQGVKEFTVKPSATIAAPLFARALEVKDAVENGVLLPRPERFTPDKKPCTECVFRTMCWGEVKDAPSSPRAEGSAASRRVSRRANSTA
jgi:uncharacterized protein (DUF2237 family)